jgi:hypothetical protein
LADELAKLAARNTEQAPLQVPLQVQVQVQTATRFGLDHRMGYRYHALQGERQPFAYDHAAWQQALQALPVPSCDEKEAREREAQARADEQRQVEDMLAGRLPPDKDPLQQAACAHDAAGVRAVLAKGRLNRVLSGLFSICKIDARTPEIFDLLAPFLYEREGEQSSWCLTLEGYLERQDLETLGRLHRLGLPVACAERKHLVRMLYPQRPAGKDYDDEQTIARLQALAGLGVRWCQPTPHGDDVLQVAMYSGSPRLLNWLLDHGCNPAVLPAMDQPGLRAPDYMLSARFIWAMRSHRFGAEQGGINFAPLAPQDRQALDARIGEVSLEEMTRVQPQTGVNGVWLYPFIRDPALLAWYAAHGARMDAADRQGRSWYLFGYRRDDGQYSKGHELLDALSVAQLQQMLKPRNLATGQPGKPLDAAKDMSPGGLGAYLCKRGAIAC